MNNSNKLSLFGNAPSGSGGLADLKVKRSQFDESELSAARMKATIGGPRGGFFSNSGVILGGGIPQALIQCCDRTWHNGVWQNACFPAFEGVCSGPDAFINKYGIKGQCGGSPYAVCRDLC